MYHLHRNKENITRKQQAYSTFQLMGLLNMSFFLVLLLTLSSTTCHASIKSTSLDTVIPASSLSQRSSTDDTTLKDEFVHQYTDESKAILKSLRNLYTKSILPLERKYHLSSFLLSKRGEIHEWLDANPIVLMIGQYSTGKTTFVRHLIGNRDFPGMHIGPEPTTDKFIALAYGKGNNNEESDEISKQNDQNNDDSLAKSKESIFKKINKKSDPISSPYPGKIIKGNSLTVLSDLPFSALSQFGSSFLSTHFQASILPARILQHLTIIDSPGILSGEKQRLARVYDFAQVSQWFADRADMILLLFDAHKLDISDELKEIIGAIRPHNEDKIRCVLNKADQVERDELVRIYGSLMWSMGKVFLTPENVRVYIGSFWDKKLKHDDFDSIFKTDEMLLVDELENLHLVAAERKVNELVRRIRLIKVHVCILGRVRGKIRRRKNRDVVIASLKEIVKSVKTKFNLSEGDIPNMELFADKLLAHTDWSIFPAKVDKKVVSLLDRLLENDMPKLMNRIGGL